MPNSEMVEIESEHSIPVSHTVDVLVAGGGPAGIAAGIAAAREGAHTLVLERYGYLGGMVTGARVIWILGMGDGVGTKARGISLDFRKRLEPLGAIHNPNKFGDYTVDPEIFKWQAFEMLSELDAEVLFHTMVCDPIIEDGRVCGVYTESKSGRRAIRAKVVVDCTADADVAYRAGCDYDNETHDVSLGVTFDGISREETEALKQDDPDRYKQIVEEAQKLNGGVMPGHQRHLKDIDITDAEALSRAESQLRGDYFRALYYLKSHMPGWQDAKIRETFPQLGVRQSRRIRGEYTVTNDDLISSHHFGDSVARLGACLLGYKLYDPPELDYDIPYRCLVPEDVDGLLVAGRSVSSDYLADNSLRLIVPCIATGQAAGVAAAIAVQRKTVPRDIDIAELRAALIRQDVYLGELDT